MIYIANWAKNHVAAARLLIGLLHIFIVINAIQLSQVLINAGVHFSFKQALILAAAGFCIIAYTGFKRKKLLDYVIRMRLQKLRFILMGICCTLLLTGFFSNRFSFGYTVTSNVQAAFTKAEKKERPAYEEYSDKKVFFNDLKAYYSTLSKKELRKELRHQFKEMTHQPSSAESAVIVLLFIILAAVAISLVAALSCSLACNGQGALAVLVLIGGIAGLVLLAAYIGRLLRKNKKTKKVEELKTAGT